MTRARRPLPAVDRVDCQGVARERDGRRPLIVGRRVRRCRARRSGRGWRTPRRRGPGPGGVAPRPGRRVAVRSATSTFAVQRQCRQQDKLDPCPTGSGHFSRCEARQHPFLARRPASDHRAGYRRRSRPGRCPAAV